MKESGVPRDELWVSLRRSTLRSSRAGRQRCRLSAVRWSVAELKLDQLDLMLIHGMWTLSENEAVDVWRGLDIDAKVAGLTKHIGVSNFEQKHIERLIAETDVKPAALQLEYHPWVAPEVHALVEWSQKRGIAVTAYGSLGGSHNKARGDEVAVPSGQMERGTAAS
jgi:2,5-diketo-D-gluconate reductase A